MSLTTYQTIRLLNATCFSWQQLHAHFIIVLTMKHSLSSGIQSNAVHSHHLRISRGPRPQIVQCTLSSLKGTFSASFHMFLLQHHCALVVLPALVIMPACFLAGWLAITKASISYSTRVVLKKSTSNAASCTRFLRSRLFYHLHFHGAQRHTHHRPNS